MGYELIETLESLVAPSLRSGRYSFKALWSLFNLYPYVSLSNYHLGYPKNFHHTLHTVLPIYSSGVGSEWPLPYPEELSTHCDTEK